MVKTILDADPEVASLDCNGFPLHHAMHPRIAGLRKAGNLRDYSLKSCRCFPWPSLEALKLVADQAGCSSPSEPATPLHFAAAFGAPLYAVKWLVEIEPASVRMACSKDRRGWRGTDLQGCLPLHCVFDKYMSPQHNEARHRCCRSDVAQGQCIRALLNAFPDAVEHLSESKVTPLGAGLENSHCNAYLELVCSAQAAKTPLKSQSRQASGSSGILPLHKALLSPAFGWTEPDDGSIPVDMLISTRRSLIGRLLDLYPEAVAAKLPNSSDQYPHDPLYLAATNSCVPLDVVSRILSSYEGLGYANMAASSNTAPKHPSTQAALHAAIQNRFCDRKQVSLASKTFYRVGHDQDCVPEVDVGADAVVRLLATPSNVGPSSDARSSMIPNGKSALAAAAEACATPATLWHLWRLRPESAREPSTISNSSGNLPLHALFTATYREDRRSEHRVLRAAQTLIAQDPPAVRTANSDQMLPLHLALEKGYPGKVIQLLLRAYPHAAQTLMKAARRQAEMKPHLLPFAAAIQANAPLESVKAVLLAYPAAALAVTADRGNPQEGMLGIHPFMVSQSEDFQNEEGVTEYAPKYLVDLVKDGHNSVKAQAKEGREEDAGPGAGPDVWYMTQIVANGRTVSTTVQRQTAAAASRAANAAQLLLDASKLGTHTHTIITKVSEASHSEMETDTSIELHQENIAPLQVEDAPEYLKRVKAAFPDKPAVYNSFLDIMKQFEAKVIDTPGVKFRVLQLYAATDSPELYVELVLGFNKFLPTVCLLFLVSVIVNCGIHSTTYILLCDSG